MKTILSHIKDNNFQPVYLLYGSEDYLKKLYKNKLKDAIVGDDTMNYSYFEGKPSDTKQISEIAGTVPFFAEKRLVVLENSSLFKTADENMVELISKLPSETIIVFVESEIDKRSKLYKAVKEKGYICELNEQSDNDLVRWIRDRIKKEGKIIRDSDIQYFLVKTGNSMENIVKELEKLVCYTLEKNEITQADIDEVCITQITNRIFDMITAMSQKNQTKALQLYYDLLTLKEPPMRIMFLISRNFNQLLMIKELTANDNSPAAIASKMGIQSFLVSKLQAQAKAFKRSTLKNAIEECVSLEEAVKTGRMNDGMAVELMIVKYSA